MKPTEKASNVGKIKIGKHRFIGLLISMLFNEVPSDLFFFFMSFP